MVCVLLRPAIAAARLGRSRCRSTVPAIKSVVLGLAAAAMLAGCSSGSDRAPDARLAPASKRYTDESYSARVADGSSIPKGGGTYKLGSPYKIGGRWYVPREEPTYDQMGVASWYGEDFHGRKTANGEVYDMNALTAAHPTLPLPSYAYVTNLNNGRTVLVRINDRGPYANDRLIDLSRQTSRMLGYEGHGLARVRIRYAGRAPLDGNDIYERRFLASQSWYGGGAVASVPTYAPPRDGPRRPSWQRVRSPWPVAAFRSRISRVAGR